MNLIDKKKATEKMFKNIQNRFEEWIKRSPTGEFKVSIPLHQGGFREPYEVGIVERERV